MRRVLRTPPKNSEPDGEPVVGAGFKPARPRRGNPCGCLFARVCPFKIRANGLLSGRRLSASPGGRGYSTSERYESSDDGGSSFTQCFPEARRSGDVGGAGSKTNCKQLIARCNRRGDASKKQSSPFCEAKGDAQAKRAQGVPYPDTGEGVHTPSIKRAKKRLNNDNATNQSPSFRRGLGGGPDNNRPKPASNTTDRQLNVSNQRGGWL